MGGSQKVDTPVWPIMVVRPGTFRIQSALCVSYELVGLRADSTPSRTCRPQRSREHSSARQTLPFLSFSWSKSRSRVPTLQIGQSPLGRRHCRPLSYATPCVLAFSLCMNEPDGRISGARSGRFSYWSKSASHRLRKDSKSDSALFSRLNSDCTSHESCMTHTDAAALRTTRTPQQ